MYRWVRNSHKLSLRSRGFMEAPWAGGVELLACVFVAMLLARSEEHTSELQSQR